MSEWRAQHRARRFFRFPHVGSGIGICIARFISVMIDGRCEMKKTTIYLAAAAVLTLGAIATLQAQQAPMTFFITSANPGKGADLGGLAGADAYCQQLAQAVGAGSRTWRAYLSLSPAPGVQPVNARDRIGRGPWQQRQGRADRSEPRGPAQESEHHQGDGADRKGHAGERVWRHAQYSRHPHRHAAGRHGVHDRRGPHLR